MPFTRLFFATDIHGSEKTYLKFLNAANFYKVSILVLGGDVTGKIIVPIIRDENGYHANIKGIRREAKDEAQLQELEKEVRASGGYPYLTDAEEMRQLQSDTAKVDSIFRHLMLETLRSWIKLAEDRLRNSGVSLYITGGNDDIPEIKAVIRESDYVIDPEERVVEIDGKYEMISLGWSNPTPWNTPRECPEEELMEKIEDMVARVRDVKKSIFNLHVPPIDTIIAECQKLDKDLKPVFEGSEPVMISGGSTAVRGAIEKYQPLLGLHGHIHESRGVVKIGRTLCVNPGSEASEGILRGVIINLDGDSVKSYQLTAG
ncbi:MAG: metallophosphoesterase [Candidatus Bathyarchaeia archaeon]